MSLCCSEFANHPGVAIFLLSTLIAIFLIAILKMGTVAYVLVSLTALFAIYVVLSLVWQIRQFGVKRRQSGQSPEQYVRAMEQVAAEQVRKAVDEWTVPPELNLPTPRPVKGGSLSRRLAVSLPFILLLAFLGYLTWGTTWKLWPSAVVGAFFLLIGSLTHRKELRLLKWGKPARAVVTSVSNNQWMLEYQNAAGELIKSSISRGSPPRNPVLTVLYDPDRPGQFIPYPVSRYAIVIPKP